MLWIGIDTHLRMHEVEIQNENGKKMWHARVENSREGFSELHEKIRTIEESNSDRIGGVFMNPPSNYHMPVKYFLESNGYDVYAVDARKTEHIRIIQNFGKENLIRRMLPYLGQLQDWTPIPFQRAMNVYQNLALRDFLNS